MSNLAYYLSLEFWPLGLAASLIAEGQSNEGRLYRSPEELAAEQWIRQKGLIIKIQQQTGPIIHTLDGVRVSDLMAALSTQDPLIWGHDLLKAWKRAKPPKRSRVTRQDREQALGRLVREVPSTKRKAWGVRDYYDALLKLGLELWISPQTGLPITFQSFERHFWKKRSSELKAATPLAR